MLFFGGGGGWKLQLEGYTDSYAIINPKWINSASTARFNALFADSYWFSLSVIGLACVNL